MSITIIATVMDLMLLTLTPLHACFVAINADVHAGYVLNRALV